MATESLLIAIVPSFHTTFTPNCVKKMTIVTACYKRMYGYFYRLALIAFESSDPTLSSIIEEFLYDHDKSHHDRGQISVFNIGQIYRT